MPALADDFAGLKRTFHGTGPSKRAVLLGTGPGPVNRDWQETHAGSEDPLSPGIPFNFVRS